MYFLFFKYMYPLICKDRSRAKRAKKSRKLHVTLSHDATYHKIRAH